MFPLVRVAVRISAVSCLLIAATLSSLLPSLIPEPASAQTEAFHVVGAFDSDKATQGETVTINLEVHSRLRVPAVSVDLQLTDLSGNTVYRKTWKRQRLRWSSRPLSLETSFVVPASVDVGDRLQASVSIERGRLTLARETLVAELEIVASDPPTVPPPVEEDPEPAPLTIQSLIDAAAPHATVHVPAGTYREKVFIHKPITLIAVPGVVVDGEDRDRWIVGRAHDVTIEGFTFINSEQPRYHGGLSNDGYNNWTIRNNTFLDAGNAAIDIKHGAGHLIENNHVSRSGDVGIRIESVGSTTIRGNTSHSNNVTDLSPSLDVGGMKITGNYGGVHNVVIENNEVYGNKGPGIWVDVDGQDIEIRHNRVHDNTHAGILYELSFRGRIHDNVVHNNGTGFNAWGFGAGILVQNSSDVEVFDNVVAWNADGIAVMSQNRGEPRWNAVTGNVVHDNTILTHHDGGWNTYGLAWLEDWDGVLSDAESNNRGFNNHFWFSTPEGQELRFRWCNEGYWTLADFSESPGGQNSHNLSESEKNQVLASLGI